LLNPGTKNENLRQAIEGFRFRRSKDPAVIAALDGIVLIRATPEELETVRERLTPAILGFFNSTIAELWRSATDGRPIRIRTLPPPALACRR
jgi:hypothetical protein